MRDFDPVRAAAGGLVQFCETGGKWVDVHYVGPDRVRGGYFVQFEDGRALSTNALRMKPPPKFALVFNDEAAACRASDTLQSIYAGQPGTPVWRMVEYPE